MADGVIEVLDTSTTATKVKELDMSRQTEKN